MSSTQKTLLYVILALVAMGGMYAIAQILNAPSAKTSLSPSAQTQTQVQSTPLTQETPVASTTSSNQTTTMPKKDTASEKTETKTETKPAPRDPSATYKFPGILPASRINNKKVTITTSKGVIVMELYPQDAPKTVSNFVYLAEKNFYNGLTFHRFVSGFVIQGGDPTGNGSGGPGYKFEDEKVTKDYDKGIVAMANAGPDTNGSQFFIMLKDTPLPKQYTIFGKVISGMDTVAALRADDVMESVVVSSK
ncbi:MAG: peptidylprolyl isomerase [Candidatus Gracilibacteria bacterium]